MNKGDLLNAFQVQLGTLVDWQVNSTVSFDIAFSSRLDNE